jgi:cytochrome oxidase Cu insertion factor (SCO1/SenC/PrrC family)
VAPLGAALPGAALRSLALPGLALPGAAALRGLSRRGLLRGAGGAAAAAAAVAAMAALPARPAAAAAGPAGSGAGCGDGREQEYFTNRVLTDQEGRPVRFHDDVLRGRTVLLGWVFTACPDACPLLAARSLAVAEAAAAAAAAGAGAAAPPPPRIVHLSTDPRRDTPARLKAWAARFGAYPDWVLLTGAPADLREVARRLGQAVDEARPDRHTTLLLAGNLPARRWAKLRPDLPEAAAAAALAEIAAAPPAAGAPPCPG